MLRKIFRFFLLIIILISISCSGKMFSIIKDKLPKPHKVKGGYIFQFFAPAAKSVNLAGDFNNWGGTLNGNRFDPSIDPMQDEDGDGVWVIVRELNPGRYEYKFVLDNGVKWESDPSNPFKEDDGYGGKNSIIIVK